MSNFGLDFGPDDEGAHDATPHAAGPDDRQVSGQAPQPRGGSRRAAPTRGRRARGCLPLLVVLVLIAVGVWFGGGWVIDKVKDLTGSSPDYSNSSTVIDKAHAVTIQVRTGDSSADIGRTLKAAGVVKSVDAFVSAASSDDRSLGIQVGFYQLNKEMKASAALAVLVEPKNLIQSTITIPEGFRVDDIVARIADKMNVPKRRVRAAMSKPAALGLPAEANGDYEGYLFPATYTVVPGATPASVLKQMIAKTTQVEADLDITAKAKALNLSPHQLLTVASILEYEGGRDEDYPKIARAIYNRLAAGQALQLDSTVAYVYKLKGKIFTTAAQRANPSPYNTYAHTGLPPGPIGAAGEKTIQAALNPAQGSWLYWVVVNLDTGETKFNDTYAGHQAAVEEFRQWCRDHSGRCQ